MADASGTPPTPWLDLLDEDIPVVDKSGKKLLVKGLDLVDASKKPAAPPPANLPTAPAAPAPQAAAAPAAPQALPLVEKTEAAQQPREVPLAKVTKDDFVPDANKDAADLKKIEAIVAARAVEPEKKAEATLLDTVVDQALTASGVALPDEDIKRRFRTLISLFFRDLRDGLETKSKFTMPLQSGGMGMADAEADRVMAELQRKNQEYHSGLAGEKAEEKAKYVAGRTEKVLTEQDSMDKQDVARREQTFSDLLQRSGVVASGAGAMSPQENVVAPSKEPKVVTVVGLDTSGKPTPTAPAAEPAVSAPTTAPTPASAPVSAPTPAPAAPAKPAMTDVKFSPKLTGPVEEIRSMTLKDFRRLSKEPREATLKIKDKIDLLEEQSFDVKTQGIKAWQDSEVNKLYLDILRKSLEGKPVPEVIADLEAKAAPYLSKAEFDVIMELNRKLRFG